MLDLLTQDITAENKWICRALEFFLLLLLLVDILQQDFSNRHCGKPGRNLPFCAYKNQSPNSTVIGRGPPPAHDQE